MKLLGMLDSPYVRRIAISLDLLGVEFEHAPLSVFSQFDAFAAINPVVKAPTLVLDDGTVLMDSSLIIDYLEATHAGDHGLWPRQPQALASALHVTGLALAACEKAVQLVYERKLRPADKQHQPWIDRVTGQLVAACRALDRQLASAPQASGERPDQAALSTAVAGSFIELMLPDLIRLEDYPVLHAHTQRLEQTELFKRYPLV
ncbi:glutathione S-transferase family protein [Pseudomonas vanderleydeniana]|uniref:Glutathione S-transferase n=1 Tax=Pseudomonas vanderleydeniana TaxID=2745495 RepID=A0A9E6PGZ7_9PSED|nr:glutathione S-transferase [Pseudomonas vanderleydeniana]QXI26210.1 glutathione S-transferase [Pseudomonas vanderleydeniana]